MAISINTRAWAQLRIYLQAATGTYISGDWGLQWSATHGETRSASGHTFHIGLRRDSAGHYWTCILVTQRNGTESPVEGTVVDWGTTPPTLQDVLSHYQTTFAGMTATDNAGGAGGNNDGNGGGAGGNGGNGGGGGYQKQVIPHPEYPGNYYYLDEDEEFHWCDVNGNDLKTSAMGSLPKDIIPIFKADDNTRYHLGPNKKHLTITFQYEDEAKKKHPFVMIASKKHIALLVNRKDKASRPTIKTDVPPVKSGETPTSTTATPSKVTRPPLGSVDPNVVPSRSTANGSTTTDKQNVPPHSTSGTSAAPANHTR
ncbi:hypothetical protein B0T24DRAFT_320254 [Lasiosphaeria ovina]|uniref:Uncharacterized protein n=1 Tax=Lasiosphaeria ovina TaxID=92902 RepID=A0AAE0K7S2_9PEZI|nr:hypothetical protein B0T24DRAFT_320254 [Lasiosphaeria ovina]